VIKYSIMSRLSAVFDNKKTLITFIMAGYPSLPSTKELVTRLDKAGADILEIGIPFSDSVADGPVIVTAASKAIKKGVSAASVIKLTAKIRKRTLIPIIYMTSYNILNAYGLEKFVKASKKSGADGLIIPDLPPEESLTLQRLAKAAGLDLIFLLAPNSSTDRIKAAAKASTGFIYLMSITGITGVRKDFSGSVSRMVSKIKRFTNKPVAVGFGISTPCQAKKAAAIADGVIVGSAIVKEAGASIKSAEALVRRLKKAIS